MAHGNTTVFGNFLGHLHEFFAAFVAKLGQDDANDLAIDGRVEAEVGCLDGFTDGLNGAGVSRLDQDHARLWRGDPGHVSQAHG